MTEPGGVELRGALSAALRTAGVRGEVSFDVTARALMTMDASNYRRVPLGVVAPRDADDVAAVLSVCREHGVPVVARGGGTSIAGQATGTGVVLDFTRHMNRLVSLDPEARTAVVQPGLVLDRLQEAAAPHGLRFGPDPSTHSRCTLGGMIGNNSCGSHSVAWGTTADSVRALSVIGGRGDVLRLGQDWSGAPDGLRPLVERELARLRTGFPDLPRRISGYALDALLPERGADVARSFCGSEGTLGVLTEAVVRLVEAPRARALAVLAYADESAAAEAAPGLLPHGPLTVEGMAADLVPPGATGLPRGGAWLFVETGGDTPAEARAHADAIVRAAGRRRARGFPRGDGRRRPARTVAHPRGRERYGDPDARRQRGLARLGGLRGTAGPTGRVPPRLPGSAPRPRPARHALRPLRRRLHPRPHRLRPADTGGHRPLPPLLRGTGRAGHLARRLPLRRTRRRPGPRRTPADHVRHRDGPPVRAGEGRLGPGRPPEPRHAGPPRAPGLQPALHGPAARARAGGVRVPGRRR